MFGRSRPKSRQIKSEVDVVDDRRKAIAPGTAMCMHPEMDEGILLETEGQTSMMKTAVDLMKGLRYMLGMFGKQHHVLYHRCRKAVASRTCRIGRDGTKVCHRYRLALAR